MSQKNNQPIIIGITGSIASGKSSFSKILAENGIPVLNADRCVHELLKSPSLIKKVSSLFGPNVKEGRNLNFKALAQIIFSQPKQKRALESLLHPKVKSYFESQTKKLAKSHKYIGWDVPLLFETGWDKDCTLTICITAPQTHILKRCHQERGMSYKETRLRLNAQWPQKKKAKLASLVVSNNKTTPHLKKQARALCQFIKCLDLPLTQGKL